MEDSDDSKYLQNLVESVRKEIQHRANNPVPESEASHISTTCKYCDEGLVIDGFCYNCGQ